MNFQKSEKNINWKGNNASYAAKHIWVKNNFGKAMKCENCGEEKKKITWANLSGKYLRDRNDWKQLCISCHRKFDYSNGSYHSCGEDYKHSKLTEKDILEIRKDYIPYKNSYYKLGKKYGVDFSTIYRIIKGKNWKYLLLNIIN